MDLLGTVSALYRYPVKSMQGETVHSAVLTERGMLGDRAYALVDVETGRIGSAHHPNVWGGLLECGARWDDGEVVVTLPDGESMHIGAALEERLSALLNRTVRFIEQAPEGAQYEFQLADVPDTAPDRFVEYTLGLAGTTTGRLGRLPVGMNAAPGSLVDVAPVHVVTTASLAALARAGGDADVRRFRPNIVIDNGDDPVFDEARLDQEVLGIGESQVRVTMPTMRCLMTTLPQHDVARSKETLAALARTNRLEVGPGHWACLGAYANVTRESEITIGASVCIVESLSLIHI